jgi:hypothetical protein
VPETRRLHRVERREQILDAATRAFARARFAATSLDDVAEEAGITRVMLYRTSTPKPDTAWRNLATGIPDGAWLDAGQPDPDLAAARIGLAVGAVIQAAQPRDR